MKLRIAAPTLLSPLCLSPRRSFQRHCKTFSSLHTQQTALIYFFLTAFQYDYEAMRDAMAGFRCERLHYVMHPTRLACNGWRLSC